MEIVQAPPLVTDVATMDLLRITVGLLGGLALFLYGIDKMADGLRSVAGNGMKSLLAKLTANRFLGVLTGIGVTAVVQSSTLTTVLVVGFVSSGLLSLTQAIGVIMGANIGTTITIQVAAFKVTHSAWLLVGLGFLATAFGKRDLFRQTGAILMGLGLLFLSLEQMTMVTQPLRNYAPFISAMQRMENPVLGIFFGAIFTIIVQSSSASTGVVLALMSQGLLTLPAALAIAIGANVGTCLTTLVAAIGKSSEAKQAALVHLIFNVTGAIVWGTFLTQLERIVSWTTTDPTRQFANAHSLFNISNTAVLIWFLNPIARLVQWIIPTKTSSVENKERTRAQALAPVLLATPSLALEGIRTQVSRLGYDVLSLYRQVGAAFLNGSKEELIVAAKFDQDVNQNYDAILDFSRKLARGELTTKETTQLADALSAANYMQNCCDIIATHLANQGVHRIENHLHISPPTKQLLFRLFYFVEQAFDDAITSFANRDQTLAANVIAGKEPFSQISQAALDQLRHRLAADEPLRTLTFQMEVDFVAQTQRIHYLARRLAKLVDRTPEPNPPQIPAN